MDTVKKQRSGLSPCDFDVMGLKCGWEFAFFSFLQEPQVVIFLKISANSSKPKAAHQPRMVSMFLKGRKTKQYAAEI